MKAKGIEDDLQLKRIIWACYKYWKGESLPPQERIICYKWVVGIFEEKFGTKFHQSKLRLLRKLKILKEHDTSRGGSRRYYKIVDPNQLKELLNKWKLN